jgi:hypothetical protein
MGSGLCPKMGRSDFDALTDTVLGHRVFQVHTGAVIPVLVRAETVEGRGPSVTAPPNTTVSTCTTPPPRPTSA